MILVGVSGVTNGGKSTLCKLLLNHFKNSIHICQDNFFHPKDSGKLEYKPALNAYNYDVFECVDSEKFLSEFEKVTNHSPMYDVVLVDGFFLFKHVSLMGKFDLKYFFTLTKDQCFTRRSKRNYRWVGTIEYFEELVWPNYMNYLDFCQKIKEIAYLDGMEEVEKNFDFVRKQIDNILNKEKKLV